MVESGIKEIGKRYPFSDLEFEITLKKIRVITDQDKYSEQYLNAVCQFSLEHAYCLTDGLSSFYSKYGAEIPAKYIPLSEHKENLKRELTKTFKIPQVLRWLGKYIK